MANSNEIRQQVASNIGAIFGRPNHRASELPTRDATKLFILRDSEFGRVSARLTFNEAKKMLSENGIKGTNDELDSLLRWNGAIQLRDGATISQADETVKIQYDE